MSGRRIGTLRATTAARILWPTSGTGATDQSGLLAIRQQRSPIRSLIPAWAILILAVLVGAIAISSAT